MFVKKEKILFSFFSEKIFKAFLLKVINPLPDTKILGL